MGVKGSLRRAIRNGRVWIGLGARVGLAEALVASRYGRSEGAQTTCRGPRSRQDGRLERGMRCVHSRASTSRSCDAIAQAGRAVKWCGLAGFVVGRAAEGHRGCESRPTRNCLRSTGGYGERRSSDGGQGLECAGLPSALYRDGYMRSSGNQSRLRGCGGGIGAVLL